MAYIDTKHLFKCETCRSMRSGECTSFCDSGECYSPDISKIPAADVVEVVRCKGCKYFTKEMIGDDLEFICKSAKGMVNPAPDKYCSYGTPKERGGEK